MGPDPRSGERRTRKRRWRRSGTFRGRTHIGRSPELNVEIEQRLASIADQAYVEMFGTRSDLARPFRLELYASVEPGHPWKLTAEPSLQEQIRAAVRDMAVQAEAYRRGRVYCYRCETSECDHSVPPTPTSVFGGYSSTGIPQWPEFGQVLLEARHPDVDILYEASRRDVAAAYVDPESLKHRQLDVFGKQSKTYDILGQVVFGYIHVRPQGAAQRTTERVAFTLQAVESRHLDGSPRIELNVLGRMSDGSPAIDALAGSSFHVRILNLITHTKRRIEDLTPRSSRRRSRSTCRALETSPHVHDMLKGLVRSLERIGRQTGRRTAHVEDRRMDNRPTSKAWEDAVSAPDTHMLWDDRKNTVVVLGPRNRFHIFSLQGRHITSLTLSSEAIDHRLRRRRWQPLSGDVLDRFRATATARTAPC